MNFNVGGGHKFGNLNDIYKTRDKAGVVLPSNKFYETDADAQHVKWLRILPHYMGYGLVICNPARWTKFVANVQSPMVVNAHKAYDSLVKMLKAQLEIDDGSAEYKGKWNPVTKKKEVTLDCLLVVGTGNEYVVVPKYFALGIFGPKCVDAHYPPWLSPPAIAKMMPQVAVNDDGFAPLSKYFYALCMTSKPPEQADIRGICRTALEMKLPMSKPLTLNVVLRTTPLDQMAVVAFVIYQLYRGMLGFAQKDETHQVSGIMVLPCGSGKTKMGFCIWQGLYDMVFRLLRDNDFGFIPHAGQLKDDVAAKPKLDSIASFFGSKSKTQVPQPFGNNETSYTRWLVENMASLDRSRAPLQTGKLLWIVDGNALLDQTAEDLLDIMPSVSIGLLQSKSRPNPMQHDVILASTKTLVQQKDFPSDYFKKFVMAILDEAHRDLATHTRQLMEKISHIPTSIFLTATPRHYGLRLIAGPVFVSASRPYIDQEHVCIILHGLDPNSRPSRIQSKYLPWKKQKEQETQENGTPDHTGMNQDMVINHSRNSMVIDTLYSICNRQSTASRPTAFELTRTPSAETPRAWDALFAAIHQNKPLNPIGSINNNVAWQPCDSIDTHYDETKHGRVPIIYAKYIPHVIILQHLMAQKWLDDAKQKPEYASANLQIVRTGLRQLAIVNMDALTPDQARRFKYVEGVMRPTCATEVYATNEKTKPASTEATSRFDAPFWINWFNDHPLCEKHALAAGKPYPFKRDADEKRKKEAAKKAKNNGLKPKVVKEQIETKRFTSTDWMYKSQYYWTPVYYPIPSSVPINKTENDAPVKKTRKRKRDVDEEEEEEVVAMSDGYTKSKPFVKKHLVDRRPPLEKHQCLATFGLYIGIGSHPAPYSLLSDIRLSPGMPHHKEALGSDYIFANFAAGSTGIDRPDCCTTAMVTPWKDPEQLHGRALRLCKTKQRVLHLEFVEPISSFRTQACTHVEGLQQQEIISRWYIVSQQQ